MIVPRTCTEISAGNEDQHREKKSRSLKEFRDAPAYVLLGDPGAGKTTAFEAECKALGNNAYSRVITADEFLTYDVSDLPSEWREKTVFIDGLDEVRASAQGASEFRELRKCLRTLNRFRLSCRQADWLGSYDQERLESVSPDSKVKVLRLDPLTLCDIENILNARSDIPDAHTFIELAKEQGVDGLLANPLSLDMLAKAVASGRGWPESRKETFEMACHKIAAEHHPGHKEAQASKNPPSSDQLLDAAGRLCAVQLISGVAGYTLHGQADEDYPTPDQCDYDRREVLRPALVTKLFKGASNNRTPIHRHLAEFLGARHLAGIIKSGLPARRVISLIEGKDGTVVTEMRGLAAWLAALCEDARTDLIKRDPVGVGLYGDICEFSTDDKYTLIESLNCEGIRLRSVWETSATFGVRVTPEMKQKDMYLQLIGPEDVAFRSLATPDMVPMFREILKDNGRVRDNQMFTRFVLDVLAEGSPSPSLSDILLEIVRDDTLRPSVNYAALNAFIQNCSDSPEKTDKLKALLVGVHTGSIPDPNNELFGVLLIQLYPQKVPPSEVWDYISETGNPNLIGMYWHFWEIDLPAKSSDEQVAELLDSLQHRLPSLRPALESHHLSGLPLRLLAQGLKAHGDGLDTKHLYDWLSVGSLKNRHGFTDSNQHILASVARSTRSSSSEDQAIRDVRSWLEQRPKVQKAILLERLDRYPKSDEPSSHSFDINDLRYGASPPPDFGFWCLKQAFIMADTKPHIAELLFEWAVRAHTSQIGNDGLSLEILREHAQSNETLKANLDRLLTPHSWELVLQKEERRSIEAQRRQEDYWLNYVRPNEIALRENRAEPALLCEMADKYFRGFYRFSGDDGPKTIAELLRDDHKLVDATLQGLHGAIDREDVPDIEEILRLKEKGRMHYLGWPFLAGLAEVERTAPEDSSLWDDRRICTALAFYYSTPHYDYQPKWYRRLLVERPEIVAEVQVQFVISGFRGDSEYSYKLSELAHDPDHAQVAKYASLPLLRAFPTRCKQKQIEDLGHLLRAAIQHADRASLEELIDRKLSRPSMNIAQRVHWLAAGIIVSPETYNAPLNQFVQVRESRIRHLVAFFDSRVQSSFDVLETPGLELLIHLVGSHVGPNKWDRQVTPVMQASRLVNGLIQRLAASPTKDASDALGRLLADSSLSRWRDVLSQAQDTQRVTWRDASYRHPTIEQVCQTLNGGTPANPGDLAGLLVDRFDEIADRIRTNNANYWRPYWNEDKNQNPTTPKHENSCRDALLDDLRLYFPNAEPEMKYVNDKRADIRVSCRDFQVPVEIKKNSHHELWSSMRNQLIAKYTSAPNTDGYGIYLVFWFGKDRTQPPPSGTRPDNSEELQERLEATLSPVEARKISVCVIDVSRPD